MPQLLLSITATVIHVCKDLEFEYERRLLQEDYCKEDYCNSLLQRSFIALNYCNIFDDLKLEYKNNLCEKYVACVHKDFEYEYEI